MFIYIFTFIFYVYNYYLNNKNAQFNNFEIFYYYFMKLGKFFIFNIAKILIEKEGIETRKTECK